MKYSKYLAFGLLAMAAAIGGGSRVELSEDQEYFLSILHPKARAKFRKFTINAKKMGWDVIFTSTYRTFAKQQQLKQQNSQNASPGYSYHNYGLAIDINIRNQEGVQMKKASAKSAWESTGIPQMGRDLGFVWGGDFATYHDPVHFDMRNFYDINTLYNAAINQYGTNWSDIKGNEVNI